MRLLIGAVIYILVAVYLVSAWADFFAEAARQGVLQ